MEEKERNYDAEVFARYNKITSKLLRSSWTKKTIEEYKKNIFFTISPEESQRRENMKEEIMKDPYKKIREQHRWDIN